MSDAASPEDSLTLSDKMAQLKTAFETLERNVAARKRGLEDGLKQVIRKKDQVPLSANSCMRYLYILSSYNVFAHLINPPHMHRRVAVVGSVCVSVCLLSQISPLEHLFALKILSHTQQTMKVIIFVAFSLKPLHCRDPAFPPLRAIRTGIHFPMESTHVHYSIYHVVSSLCGVL